MKKNFCIFFLFFFFSFKSFSLSPLHQSALKGDLKKIEELLAKGEDINKWDYGTPLMYAAGKGHIEVVKFLVSKGADVNIESNAYGNALCWALTSQKWEVAKFLIYAGTDIEKTYEGLKRYANFVSGLGTSNVQETLNNINLAVKKLPEIIFDVSNIFFNEGKYEKVIYLANEIIKKDPKNAIAYAVLAHGYNGLGKYDDAINSAEKSLSIEKTSLAYMAIARAKRGKDDLDGAITFYKNAIELEPKGTSAYFEIGTILALKEKFKEAKDYFKKQLEIQPNSGPAMSFIAFMDLEMGQYEECINDASKVIDMMSFSGVGTRIKISNNYPVITEILKLSPAEKVGLKVGDKIIKIDGKSTKGWALNDVVQSLTGKEGTKVNLIIEREGVSKPIEFIITREKIIPIEISSAFAIRGLAYKEMGKKDEFFKDAEMTYNLNSDNNFARTAMAISLLEKEKYEEALKILSTSQSNFDFIIKGIIYAKIGELDNSVQIYSELPDEILLTKSIFKKNYINLLQTLLKPYKETKLKNGKDYEDKGLYKEAIKEYADYVKIADDKEAKEIYLHIAEIMNKYPDLFIIPEEARKLIVKGEVYTSEKEFKKAIVEYKNALKIFPFYPDIYKNIALNYEKLNDYEKAIKYLKIYLTISPNAKDARIAQDIIYKWEFMIEREKN